MAKAKTPLFHQSPLWRAKILPWLSSQGLKDKCFRL